MAHGYNTVHHILPKPYLCGSHFKNHSGMYTIGLIREGKTPPDKRVPLTPQQCKHLMNKYTHLRIMVQPSAVRAFPDHAYASLGLELSEDLSPCDLILGVKEVPVSMLIPGKAYMFFSHTIKKQPSNRSLLKAILEKKISLIDYEVLTDQEGRRLIGFGRYAGIVGAYNTLRGYGERSGLYTLKPAHLCANRAEVDRELQKVHLPKGFRLLITGGGRVAGGALEILATIGLRRLSPNEYLSDRSEAPAYAQLSATDYMRRSDGRPFTAEAFYTDPSGFESDFMKWAAATDVYMSCHFWSSKSPIIFSAEDARRPEFRINMVGDISCDVNGPIASTIRPSTIANPFYGYDPYTEGETDFLNPGAIGVMAIDNLPCELPLDASEDFGNELIDNIFPELLEKEHSEVIERARETDFNGRLTARYAYLSDYAAAEV